MMKNKLNIFRINQSIKKRYNNKNCLKITSVLDEQVLRY